MGDVQTGTLLYYSALEYELGGHSALFIYVFPQGETQETSPQPVLKVEYTIPRRRIASKEELLAGDPNLDEIITVKHKRKPMVQSYPAAEGKNVGVIYAAIQQEYYTGTMSAVLEWTQVKDAVASKQSATINDIVLGKRVNVSTEISPKTPQVNLSASLVKALREDEKGVATVTYSDAMSEEERAQLVGDILVHIESRLKIGLGPLWQHADPLSCCHEGVPLCECTVSTMNALPRKKILECWAQHASELLVGGPYEGPGTNMGLPERPVKGALGPHKQDAFLFSACVSGTRLAIPLLYKCQQLTTMALICLGHDSLASNPLGAGGPITGELPGNFEITTEVEWKDWCKNDWPSATEILAKKLIDVGTVFYHTGGTDHCAATLRVGETPPRLQLVDTGGWIFDSTGNLRATEAGKGYIWDTTWEKALTKDPPMTFNGVMRPPRRSESELVTAIERMRKARMIGAVRLAVRTRKSGKVWWLSPLLPMESPDTSQTTPYSLARLMAALRGCPHAESMTVEWEVVIPVAGQNERTAWVNWLKDPSGLNKTEMGLIPNISVKNYFESPGTSWWSAGTLNRLAVIEVTKAGLPHFRWKAPPLQDNTHYPFPFRRDDTDNCALVLDAATLEELRKKPGLNAFADMSTQTGRVGPYFNRPPTGTP